MTRKEREVIAKMISEVVPTAEKIAAKNREGESLVDRDAYALWTVTAMLENIAENILRGELI